jgi:L-lactate dehydrogenase (cytochrome)
MRQKFDDTTDGSAVQTKAGEKVEKNQGAARAISSFIDPGLSWKDMDFFKSITKMPIILKGVQTWEDAVMAAEAGLQGVVLSNHGGRQLDGARSGLEVLVEVVRELKAPTCNRCDQGIGVGCACGRSRQAIHLRL